MSTNRTLAMSESEEIVGKESIRAPFSIGLLNAADVNKNIVLLTADLGKYTDTHDFKKTYPDRFFNVGMAEQSLIMTAAGLSKVGKIAYCTTYGTFATRRAYDFISIASAHSNENVKIFAGNPGLTTGYGGTHQANEDLALMRTIPNITVLDPCDATEMIQIAQQAAQIPGTLYCRLLRAKVAKVFDHNTYKFKVGKGYKVPLDMPGPIKIGFVSTGFMTERAIDASKYLQKEKIYTSVFHSPCIKPFDKDGLLNFAKDLDGLVVCENHIKTGGLSTLVIETLQEAEMSKKVLKIGIPDKFTECGSLNYLQDKYGLTTDRVIEQVKTWLTVI